MMSNRSKVRYVYLSIILWKTMIWYSDETPKQQTVTFTEPAQIRRSNAVVPNTTHKQEVTNIVEVRKPTIDEMKMYFLMLLKDPDVVEAVRKLFIPPK